MLKAYLLNGVEPNKGILNFEELLDAPAGKYGFLGVKDGHLCFENGKRSRFIGVSMVGAGCLPKHDTADAVADRLASSGINLVRMHYMDGMLSKKAPIRLIDYAKGSSRNLNEEALERLDYFTFKLRERGIYVQLDTFVGRNWMPEGDELDYPDQMPTNWAPKQANIFNRRMIELQKEYQTKLLTHQNRYTGLRYVDDPAIAVVQIMNENSLLWDFGANFNMDSLPPHYKLELKEKWRLYLKQKYTTNEALRSAWTDLHGICNLMAIEHIDYMVQLPTAPYATNDVVGAEYDENQLSLNAQTRMSDFIDFLIGIESDFYREMNEHLRAIGVKCPINGSNLIRGMANVYTSSRGGDIQEQDSYYNHPYLGFAPPAKVMQRPMVKADPRENLNGQATDCNMLTNDATAAVEGRPLMVAEWNDVNPTPFDADGMLEMTSYAAFQDWDGACCFMYNENDDISGLKSQKMDFYFTIFNDPSKWGQLGISSYVFQNECVSPARHCVYLCCTKEDMRANAQGSAMVPYATVPYFSKIAVKFSDDDTFETGENDLAVSIGYTPTGDFTKAAHAVVFSDSPYADLHHKAEGRKKYLDKHTEEGALPFFGIGKIGEKRLVIEEGRAISHDAYAYGDIVSEAMRRFNMLDDHQGIVHGTDFVSDTGEIAACPGKGTFTVRTPRFAAFAGQPDGEVDLGVVKAEIKNEYMALSLLARDGKTLTGSKHILLTAIGKTMNTDVKFDGEWLLDLGRAPVLVDQFEGRVTFPGIHEGLTVYALKPSGERREALKVTYGEGGAEVSLTTDEGTIHFELVLE